MGLRNPKSTSNSNKINTFEIILVVNVKICKINWLQLRITVYVKRFYNLMYSWEGKGEFSAAYLQASVSLDTSEIILAWRICAQ